ncbi:MAG: DUF1295 domain-containing protein [Patescibacteria group bacterium]|nr:DUF1295 domain-containing protein [Patescibacteria group bacterium]
MWHIILLSLACSLAINLLLFLVAFKLRSDKLTDISYSLSFLAISVVGLVNAPNLTAYRLLIFLMVAIWAVRLGSFLLIRVFKVGKDQRFDEIRNSFIGFGKFWLGQAVTAWIVMLPATLALYRGSAVTSLVLIGFAIWLLGVTVEGVADYQKFAFKQNPANNGKWIDNGIWKYSRHPNYFGEIAVWVGVYLACFPALNGIEKVIGLASPILISSALLFISGVPILEKSADKRWGKLPAYTAYKKRTRLLIPLPKLG